MSSRIRQSFLPGDYKSTTKKYLGGKMKKFVGFMLVAFFIATGTLFLMPTQSEAVPAFARQTGQACVSCHFGGNYPVLSEFGREFKAGGFTMVGGESLISGDALSLPSVLNAAVIGKFRYSKATGGKWELDNPDEMALFFGGRVGENIGFLLEVPIKGGGGNFANFELPFEFHAGDIAISAVPFSTDGAGPLRGYELLNTAWVDGLKPLERSKGYAAGRILGTDVPAEGLTLAARKSGLGYVAVTMWRPNHDNTLSVNKFSNVVRAVYNNNIGDWNVAAGLLGIFGKTTDSAAAEVRAKLFGLDAQLQGNVSNMPLGVYLSYGSAGKTNAGDIPNLFNGNANNETAFGLLAQLGVIPNKATLSLGGHIAKTGAGTNDKNNGFIAGASYQYTQNVKFELDQEWYSGSANTNAKLNPKNRTTLMAFMGF